MQNSGFPENWLYELKQRNNIVSIIGKYVRLEKKGSKYWACCPFHNEKTPSFTVNEDEGFYHCFGCKESGDVISFIMKYESCDFLQAIEILDKNANMEVPKFTGEKEVFEKKGKKDRIIKLLDETYKHYQSNLYLPKAKVAQEYVKGRKFTKSDLENFKIGYSDGPFEIVNYLKSRGFKEEEMLEAGVVRNKDKHYFDINANRLVFPIFNSFNECVGFSSRVLDKSLPKYINTPETLVFHKGRVVFGINLVKALKQQGLLDKIIVVEGQIDVIAMHRAGFKSTVACMGTAMTKENAHELKKLSNSVVLCFDGDTAGQKATLKSIEVLKEEGLDVKVTSLPGKHDPDEIIQKFGLSYIQKLIENALPTMDYLIEIEKKKYHIEKPDEKGQFVTASLKHIASLDSESEEDAYLEKIKKMTTIPMDILRRDLNKIKNKDPHKKNDETKEENVLISRQNGNIRAIKFVLSSLIYKKDFVDKRINYQKLLPKYKDIIEKAQEGLPISSYFDYFDVESNPVLKDCIEMNFEEFKDNGQRYFEECLWLCASQNLLEQQNKINEQFKNCEDSEQRRVLALKLQGILKAIKDKNLEEFYDR